MNLLRMKRLREKICMVTCYDFPSGVHVDSADMDIALCGDSLGMVALGYETTQPVTLDEMLHHCRAVRRGLSSDGPLLVCDLPFGSYEESPKIALRAAHRVMKEGGADAVKLEGGLCMTETIRTLVQAGVAVMGHVGLTPQAIATLGGFRAQGRTAVKARKVLDDALALQDAGAFAVVLECVPGVVAAAVTSALDIPTVGIGAGSGTDGQVLVYHDLLGVFAHPQHVTHVPKFCKVFADVGQQTHLGLTAFRDDIKRGIFPSEEFSPYCMPSEEAAKFQHSLQHDKLHRKRASLEVLKRQLDQDEYEIAKLY